MCKISSECPWCGENKVDILEYTIELFHKNHKMYCIRCFSCGEVMFGDNKWATIERWRSIYRLLHQEKNYDPDSYLYREVTR